ncbi:Undecaprenyl-phosphate N-acetylglucosaminyl 1-phosphate transferase [Patulibacter medicamentivorans]|uniref:Undecaprenyl-phosphate N-acetylglucosaminyl 1-phosphate transferase n=1 Tax=Patulibacter medicamentivorans TaxID=1097667 RepID=H0E4G6_9ACTN|nr:MraY family glycosyltransferase [Patulibacter medicamentivorans]EHN11418.1 Undecaprenyl-phosphate N-acetylglucosaminyl 1-phosphate transferase [Patulibacter medicamentivorans]
MTWRDPFVALLVAFSVAAAVTPLVARLARLAGAVDRPRGRGVALGGTPLLGGLAIAAGVAVAVLLSIGDLPSSPTWDGRVDNLHHILLGGLAITVVGVLDDRFDLHPLAKLAGQAAAAWIPVSQGVEVGNITLPFIGAVDFGSFGVPLTILGFVAIMNVVNLSDGVDGLAAGVCAIAAIALGIVAWDLQKEHASLLAGATCGAALGFLVHNFHPARVFMGDTGANLLGFLLAAVAVEGTVKTGAVLALVVPLMVLAVPFLDTTFVVLKRLKARQPIYGADQNHFHHRLSRLGFSQRRVVLYLYAWAAALAGVAIALRFVPYNDDRDHYDPLWTSVIVVIVLLVLAFSVYLVYLLEIVKLRRLDALRLRHLRPDVSEQDIDDDVTRALQTGEIDAITGEHLAVDGAPPGPPTDEQPTVGPRT